MDVKDIKTDELAKKVMAKLDERLRIGELARQIKKQLALAGALMVDGEGRDPWENGRKETWPRDCGTKPGVTHDCKGATTHKCNAEEYECKAAQIYSCLKFECENEYSCKPTTYDHWCGGDFDCKEHDCAGKHGFFCDDDHTCKVVFKCKHCNPEDCNAKPKTPYTRHDDDKGGIDRVSGDFTCGYPDVKGLPEPDVFTCVVNFECAVRDQFECSQSTTFTCGNGAADDKFVCNTQNDKFECDQKDGFHCSQTIAPYSP
jgi:hypothetical protein